MSIVLQRCAECGAINYPAREVCRKCLGDRLEPAPVSGTGTLLARSTLHVSGEAVFRARLPWRIGSVRLDCGAVLIVHLASGAHAVGEAVTVRSEMVDGRMAFFADAACDA